MLSIVANILYVLVAIAMTALILLQRGAGAAAGSGLMSMATAGATLPAAETRRSSLNRSSMATHDDPAASWFCRATVEGKGLSARSASSLVRQPQIQRILRA